MVLIRIVTFVFYILIFMSITTISPLAYGQDEEEDDQDQMPQVNDPVSSCTILFAYSN
jgi:hypothetical protein